MGGCVRAPRAGAPDPEMDAEQFGRARDRRAPARRSPIARLPAREAAELRSPHGAELAAHRDRHDAARCSTTRTRGPASSSRPSGSRGSCGRPTGARRCRCTTCSRASVLADGHTRGLYEQRLDEVACRGRWRPATTAGSLQAAQELDGGDSIARHGGRDRAHRARAVLRLELRRGRVGLARRRSAGPGRARVRAAPALRVRRRQRGRG
jgi:hypothetical protein